MEDKEIISLYISRNEEAILETSKKYGSYCKSISMNILHNSRDVEECINDTYLRTWNSIPPNVPDRLSVYLAKITRNLSFDIYKKTHAKKRGSNQIEYVLDELSEMIPGGFEPETEIVKTQIMEEINEYLARLSKEKRKMFVCRYWYADSIKKISKQFKVTENNVSVILNRIRKDLRKHLMKRGYYDE